MASCTIAPSAVVLELLNLDNYEHWSRRVQTYLLAEGLWKVVEANGDPDPDPKREDDEEKFDAWSRQNAKALHVMHISCGSGLFPLISDATSARVAWHLLARTFKSDHFNCTDERSDFPTRLDGGRRRNDANLEIKEATDVGHENHSASVADQEAFVAKLATPKYTRECWDEVMEYLKLHPEAARIRDPKTGCTALHIAVLSTDAKVVEEMVQLMEEEDLEIKDVDDHTAFFYALLLPSREIVECLVRKNRRLVSTHVNYPPVQNVVPVLVALSNDNWEVAKYLYNLTPLEYLKPENGPSGADIITTCIHRKKNFDIALHLIQRCPNLAISPDFFGNYPLNLLAGLPSTFFGGTSLTFCQRWIYDRIHIEDNVTSSDAPIDDDLTPQIDEGNQMDLIESGLGTSLGPEIFTRQTGRHAKLRFWQHVWNACNAIGVFFQQLFMVLLRLSGMYHCVYKMKLVHVRHHQLLNFMSVVTRCDIKQLHDSAVQRAIFRAIQHGNVEFILVLVLQNPHVNAIDICDKRGKNYIKYAIECRQEKVYNLIHDYMDEHYRHKLQTSVDHFQNSLLHIVASLSPSIKFNHVRGAALQMQRELQWFKEVENFIPPDVRDLLNYEDKMTGRELFTKNHKELVKKGEKSMKETATSCTVVGALIVTIMFAAAFTVGGGNDQNTGLPMFLDETFFMVFIVSDALSLFSSTTSVMIFLGILTSRYQEDDFHWILPTKMMVALLTLFFSVAAMMIAFSTTLILMLRDKYSWIVVPIILLACVPITAFVWMQFPFLYEICISTYGPGMFRKRRIPRRYRLKKFYARMKGRVVREFTAKLKNEV